MKKHILLILLLAAAGGSVQADSCCSPCSPCSPASEIPCDRMASEGCEECRCKAVSHTFFSVRPEWEAGSPERLTLFRRDRMIARDKDSAWKGGLQIALFGGKSTHAGRLANFFGPFCKTVLNVTEDEVVGTDDTPGTDIRAHLFNIYTNNEGGQGFHSTISFAPQRSVVGFGIDYKQAFAEYKDGHYFWWEIAAPIVHIKTTMNLRENVINNGGGVNTDFVPPAEFVGDESGVLQGPVANMTEAFAQSIWKCGKIVNCNPCDSTFRIADIDLRLGYDLVSHDTCYLESYLGILIPTGNKVKNTYVFEPIAGHNKNFGFLAGSNLGYELWKNKKQDKCILFDFTMHGLFLLKNRQHRLVDLKYKPWSRYMPVYANEEQALAASQASYPSSVYLQTPGVNVFCQDLCVSPGFERTYNAAFILDVRGFQGEIGYNFFARSPECLALKCPWVEGPALKADCFPVCVEGDVTTNCVTGGVTNSVQTINHAYPLDGLQFSADNYALNLIKESDLDLESAAHPAMLIHTAYGSMGYRWDDYEMPWFLGAGGSYEFSRDNTGMNRWLLWVKGGFSF